MSKDIQNARQMFSTVVKDSATHGALLLKQIEELAATHPDWYFHIEKEGDDLLYLLVQTTPMQELSAKYSDVIFIDGTYKVNAESFTLYSILCEDGTEHGRPICYALLWNEKDPTLRSVLQRFLDLNPRVCKRCKVAVVDKKITQPEIIRDFLPSRSVLLCTWHALKRLREKIRADFDLKKTTRAGIEKLLKAIIYARTVPLYESKLRALKAESPSPFFEYFMRNWHSYRDLWAHALRRNVPRLGNNTINRIESHNEKIKKYVNNKMHLTDTLKYLLQYESHALQSLDHSNFLEIKAVIDTNTDDFHTKVSQLCTKGSARLIFREFDRFMKGS